MIKVLFIAYYFPPVGGAGTQRSLKFVKYLPDFGVLPIVLTGSGKSKSHWSPKDESMMTEVPKSVAVHRVEKADEISAELEQWISLGRQIIKDEKVDLIFVTMSPFAHAQIASELSESSGVPWVADLRDPWAFDEFQVHKTILHRRKERQKMQDALSTSSMVIMNTPESQRLVQEDLLELEAKRIHCITNGFDRADFDSNLAQQKNEQFTIVHTGYLHAQSGFKRREMQLVDRLLGRTIGGMQSLGRSHFYLMKSLERLIEAKPEWLGKIKIIFAGIVSETDKSLIENSSVSDCVELTGYVSHEQSVELLQGADLLFLPMHTLKGGRRTTIVPGKTYEYMAARKRILAAVPEGDAKDFVMKSGLADCCEPDDIYGMSEILEKRIQAWELGVSDTADQNSEFVNSFERKVLSERLAQYLKSVNLSPTIES